MACRTGTGSGRGMGRSPSRTWVEALASVYARPDPAAKLRVAISRQNLMSRDTPPSQVAPADHGPLRAERTSGGRAAPVEVGAVRDSRNRIGSSIVEHPWEMPLESSVPD